MAAITEARICNAALIKVGADRIANLSQDKKEAKLCNVLYEMKRDELLALHEWNFAIERKELAADSEAPIADFSYQYSLPTTPKCLRVLEVTESFGNWTIEGNKLLTDDSAVEIRYIAQVTDTSKFSRQFVAALTALLASELALAISDNLNLSIKLAQEYERIMKRARGVDNIEKRTVEGEPDLWTD